MRIGVDVMGGDFAPDAVVSGAVLALKHLNADERIVLFGNQDIIINLLQKEGVSPDHFDIIHTSEVIEMGDNPSKSFAKKTDSSIVKGFMALAAGKVDGFASAGSTGAMMVGAMMVVKQIPGVIRPAIAGFIPVSDSKVNLLLDVGLNPDCRPDILYQYGILGSIYAKQVLGIENPRISLLNIGEEDEKGNLVTKSAFEMMKDSSDFNFVGNVEGHHLFHDKKADVVVCDGFVGNVVLKQAEAFYHILTKVNPDNKFNERFNSENYGGTPVLGVNKPVIIIHGASSPKAIMNMIIQTREVISSQLCEKIKQAFRLMGKITAAITGVGGFVPEYILTNEELSRMVDTTDEWIMTRIGIKERHILKGEGLGTSDMAVHAVNELLRKTNTKPEEVDMLICGVVTPDMQFPATANIISDKCGVKNAFGYDLNAGCSSFLYALITASKFVESGTHKKVVVVGADKMSSITDYTDRSTCPIFGDGAGAVLLEPCEDEFGLIDAKMQVDGSGRKHLHQVAGGSCYPASIDTVTKRQHYIYQEGQPVFKAAVSNMADVSVEMMKRNNISPEQLAWLVPHQANMRIIEATANRMGISKEQVMINIERYGNTTSATIPLCLWEWEPKLKKGDNIIIATFGAGFTWGACYIKWAYDGDKVKK